MIKTYLISSKDQVYGSITRYICVQCWTAKLMLREVQVDKFCMKVIKFASPISYLTLLRSDKFPRPTSDYQVYL